MKFRIITKCKNKECKFNSDPIQYLMKDCDNEKRKVIEKISSKSEESNVDKFGKHCIRTNDEMIDRPVREAVLMIDVIESDIG